MACALMREHQPWIGKGWMSSYHMSEEWVMLSGRRGVRIHSVLLEPLMWFKRLGRDGDCMD
jgi:hypothetical protein